MPLASKGHEFARRSMTASWPLAALAARAAQAIATSAGGPATQVLLITAFIFGSSVDIAVVGQQGNSLLAPWPATAASWVEA